MSTREDDEDRAKSWLRAQGYEASRPTWLPPGKNPDFWAESSVHSPAGLWVEVKSIEPDNSTATMDRLSGIIGGAHIPSNVRGHAILELEPGVEEQSVRWVLKKFATCVRIFSEKRCSLLFLQQTPNCGQEYYLEIEATKPMVVWARASELPLEPPTAIRDDLLYSQARVRGPDGVEIVGPAYKFFEPRNRKECALVVHLDPDDAVLDGISYMCGGSGQTRERTGRVLPVANKQLKVACETRDAAGIVVLTPRGPFGDNDQMMQAAIYGQYTVPIRLNDMRLEHGGIFHGSDGVFRPNKNTHISAAVHVRRNGPATFFPNPFARHVIPDDAPLFAGAQRADVAFV